MKKQIVSILTLILAISLCACSSNKEIADTTPAEATTQSAESSDAEVTQADIEERIVGRWMTSEKDGQPTLTNEKNVFNIVSATEVYVSLSRTTGQSPWEHGMEGNVDIKGNVVTITTDPEDGLFYQLYKNFFHYSYL